MGALGIVGRALDYTLAGVRGGGAVAYYTGGEKAPADLVLTGRWDSMKSATHYLHEAIAISAWLRISPEAQRKVDAMKGLLVDLCGCSPNPGG